MIQINRIYMFKKTAIAIGISLVFFFAAGCVVAPPEPEKESDIPDFTGKIAIELNQNIPLNDLVDITLEEGLEFYSELDELGRCGVCYAYLDQDMMPDKEREEIGHIRPSGWHTVKYSDLIDDGLYLYNRCHLIGYQLSGENDNPQNLITGTRYMNTKGMLPYENMVSRYIRETGNHVLYRVTPVFESDNLVAKGVRMEAYSVEDKGTGLCFHVFVYNIQPGIRIDYLTGESCPDASVQIVNEHAGTTSDYDYILNIKSGKFHYGTCYGVYDMKDYNKEYFKGNREQVLELGYEPCGSCKP